MTSGAIYIDDAGTPGVIPPSEFLPEDRKSFCAVIVPTTVAEPVNTAMSILINGVEQDFGTKELHCTDIYSGRGHWRGVAVAKRIEIFNFLESILSGFDLPVLFQTWSSASVKDHSDLLSNLKIKQGSWWDINDISHFSLLLLCFNVAEEFNALQQHSKADFPSPLNCYIDEGLVKANTEIELPNWGNVFENQKLNFVKSEDCPGIQLADFAAFCIARSQWILAKQASGEAISDADQHILKIASKINWVNAKRILVDPQNFSREGYEFVLMRDRQEKKLPRKFKQK